MCARITLTPQNEYCLVVYILFDMFSYNKKTVHNIHIIYVYLFVADPHVYKIFSSV